MIFSEKDTEYQMATMIHHPTEIEAAGKIPKLIHEYIGRINTKNSGVSIALMKSPGGWTEPGQQPDFDEYTLVLKGVLRVETKTGTFDVRAGEAVHAPKHEWVRYSSPGTGGAEYVAVCVPAFSPETVHRDH